MTRKLALPCPHCRSVVNLEGLPFPPGFQCDSCQKVFAIEPSEALQAGDPPDRCVICGDDEFYLEKDMPRGLGTFLVILAILLVPWTYNLSLFVVAFLQIPFFLMLKMRYVCYGCQALYRGYPKPEKAIPFDHEIATMRELKREKAEAAEAEAEAEAAEPRAEGAAS